MVALLIENSKLIMIFLLIGTIIGLAYFGNRPYRPGTREGCRFITQNAPSKKGPAEAGPGYFLVFSTYCFF